MRRRYIIVDVHTVKRVLDSHFHQWIVHQRQSEVNVKILTFFWCAFSYIHYVNLLSNVALPSQQIKVQETLKTYLLVIQTSEIKNNSAIIIYKRCKNVKNLHTKCKHVKMFTLLH